MSNALKLTPEEIQANMPAVINFGAMHFASQALYGLVKLGVPDIIGASSLTAAEIAAKLPGTPNVDVIGRSLRLLGCMWGMFDETANENGEAKFALSKRGALLQTGVPGQPSLACGMLHWNEPCMWNSIAQIPQLQSGEIAPPKTPFEAANNDVHIWPYFQSHPESFKPFNEFMTQFSMAEVPLVTNMYDWSPFKGKTILDVGGGYGHVVAAIKEKVPEVEVATFDLPEVLKEAETSKDAPANVKRVPGDFFKGETFPKVDGAIFMKHIIHDWLDAECITILKNCRQCLEPGAKVICADAVLPNPGETSDLKVPQCQLDVVMFVNGGKERSKAQWEELAKATGFVIESITPTPAPVCQLVTLVPA